MSHEYLATLPIPANFWDRAKQLFTHTEFSYYVRLATALCATAGFIPFEPNIVRNIIGSSRTTTVEAFLDRVMLFCEYRLLDISQVPEDFRVLLGVDAQYDGKIFCLCEIHAIAMRSQEKRRNAAIAADCRHKKLCEEKEKKRSKRKEKEFNITNPQDKVCVITEGTESEMEKRGIERSAGYEETWDKKERGSMEDGNISSGIHETREKAKSERRNSGEPVSQSASQPEKCFSFRNFRNLWNKWAEHFGVAQFQKLNTPLKAKFETRQKSFKAQGAETQMFWVNLLSAIAETSGGFYLGKNDGYRHCGTPWIITAKWLLENDEHVERFLNAVK